MKKTTDELRKELEAAIIREKQLANYVKRLENRKRYMEQGERKKRTHHLCNIGGAVESIFPDVAVLTKTEFYMLMEKFADIPEVNITVQQVVERHKKIYEQGDE